VNIKPMITVITGTVGHPMLTRNIESVYDQVGDYNIQHLIFIDGPERTKATQRAIDMALIQDSPTYRQDIIQLPYSVGKDRWNGHRMMAAGCYLADGDYIVFLDDDNTLLNCHFQSCIETLERTGADWTYSFRNIVDSEENWLCQDNCESLGIWPSVLSAPNNNDHFVDVNCYFLKRNVAVSTSPCWFRKFREPGQAEVDRVLCQTLLHHFPKVAPTQLYTVNYMVGNTPNSVQAEFFTAGNEEMLRRYNNKLPWKLY